MSTITLRLDQGTMSEWQRQTQDSKEVPHYAIMWDFLDLRGHAGFKGPCRIYRALLGNWIRNAR